MYTGARAPVGLPRCRKSSPGLLLPILAANLAGPVGRQRKRKPETQINRFHPDFGMVFAATALLFIFRGVLGLCLLLFDRAGFRMVCRGIFLIQ